MQTEPPNKDDELLEMKPNEDAEVEEARGGGEGGGGGGESGGREGVWPKVTGSSSARWGE